MTSNHLAVRLTGGFWKQKEELNRNVTIPAVYDRFYETGRIDAFRCDWKPGMPNQPHIFWDSDVAKWMEGVAYILSREDNPELEQKVESLIDLIVRNQREDGYFNLYYMVVAPDKRYTDRDCHELYCAGHLIEAAVAYYEATGRDRFLRCMEKYAAYIKAVFMDRTAEPTPAFDTPGHEEIELALYKLYRCTGNRDWLDLCAYFLNTRGTKEDSKNAAYYLHHQIQSHLPVREQVSAKGHSVRAGYLYTAMADLAGETGDAVLMDTCRKLYKDITEGKMYITGGVGSTHDGEAYTIPYDLPNDQAYTETCASIAMIYFSQRMLNLEKDARYADTVEKELYNGMLSGLSLSGDAFFYENPLEIHLDNYKKQGGRYPIFRRQVIFECSCCPPNLNRMLASLGQYFYSWEEREVWVNQFGDSTLDTGNVTLTQTTEYPVCGKITLRTEGTTAVHVRIPGWCRSFRTDRPYVMDKGYAVFTGDGEIVVELTMEPVLMQSNTGVYKNLDRVALQYGPLVYCAEGIDNGGDVHSLYFDTRNPGWKMEVRDGYPVFTVHGFRRIDPAGELYYPLAESFRETEIKLIPYHTFANREETNMLVFLGYR